MTYQVLARKWRPQRFADVVGQEHITRTLQNAIIRGRVGHAYLFVGPRGIGKTTLARIFAKALNCEKGMVSEPCCECPSCLEIFRGNALDVIEMDAASHTGVDYIRDIRETVQYTPTHGRYKIYIIDEVHMLSTAAWNALLKTLEEPPPHVKFLFATTEPHRVLPTILSRCQRLDLKRIPLPLIMGRLRQIADAESIWIDDPALAAISRAADGGMRDGQSIFDQMIAFCGGRAEAETIREQDVLDVFGLASGAELKEISLAMLRNEPERMMGVIQELADRGRDLEHLLADLIYYFRNAMVFQLSSTPERVLEAGAAELDELREVTQGIEPDVIQRLLEGLLGQEYFVRSMLNKRVALEVALVRTVREAHSVQLDAVIARLNQLRSGNAPPPEPSAGGSPAGHSAAPRHHSTDASLPRPATPLQPMVKPTVPSAPPPKPPAVGPTISAPTSATTQTVIQKTPEKNRQKAVEVAAGQPTPTPPPSVPAASAVVPDSELWPHLLETAGREPGPEKLKNLLAHLRPVGCINNSLMTGYDETLSAADQQLLETPEAKTFFATCCSRAFPGRDLHLVVKRWIENVSAAETKPRLTSTPEARRRVEQNPLVQQICALFNAKVIDARG